MKTIRPNREQDMPRPKSNFRMVTSHDVARKAGVSQATVSLAMRGSDQVSAKRIEQIRSIAKEMGYFPRAAGQMLRNRKTGYLGLILAAKDPEMAISSGFLGPVLARFVRACSESNTPYLIDFHHHETAKHVLPSQVASGLVDGVIVVGDVGKELTAALQERGDFPWVSVGEISNYCVLNDAKKAIKSAVDHLLGFGHERIAYAGGPDYYQEHLESRQAFEAAIQNTRAQKLPPNWSTAFSLDDSSSDYTKQVYDWAVSLLSLPDRPTAMVCRSETHARTVLYAAANLGLKVPTQLSVISWGWANEAARRYPTLTTLAYDVDQLVSQSIELLTRRMEDPELPQQTLRVPMQLVAGNTTGPIA